MKWLWRLHREWKNRAEAAEAEVERSQKELERTRKQVITPLAKWRDHNHFAQLIHDSLINGEGR
jgi:hypothetical protein